MQLEAVGGPEDLVAQEACRTSLFKRLLETLVHLEDLTMDVVVAHGDAHGVSRDGHAFDDDVGVVGQDVAVFAGAGLAFIGVAHEVLGARKLARHKAPLQAGRETRTTAAAQRGGLDLGNDLVGRHARAAIGAQDLLQRGIAAAGHVILQTPVGAIQPGVDLRVDVAPMETGFSACGLEAREERQVTHLVHPCPFKVSTRSSSRSWLMKLSILRSFTSMTGASAQAPRHSLGCTVKAPSAVVP